MESSRPPHPKITAEFAFELLKWKLSSGRATDGTTRERLFFCPIQFFSFFLKKKLNGINTISFESTPRFELQILTERCKLMASSCRIEKPYLFEQHILRLASILFCFRFFFRYLFFLHNFKLFFNQVSASVFFCAWLIELYFCSFVSNASGHNLRAFDQN